MIKKNTFHGAQYRLPQPGRDFMSGRFDYVRYDERAINDQNVLKFNVENLENLVGHLIKCPRSKALVMSKLEEAYMWIGKGIRNDQIERNRSAESQEERTNS